MRQHQFWKIWSFLITLVPLSHISASKKCEKIASRNRYQVRNVDLVYDVISSTQLNNTVSCHQPQRYRPWTVSSASPSSSLKMLSDQCGVNCKRRRYWQWQWRRLWRNSFRQKRSLLMWASGCSWSTTGLSFGWRQRRHSNCDDCSEIWPASERWQLVRTVNFLSLFKLFMICSLILRSLHRIINTSTVTDQIEFDGPKYFQLLPLCHLCTLQIS